ncbi:hypothetical protein G3M55_76535, partial [Streptomyces sp. SID8455]|nr:hypothetical protein [Streptomyces sp. SID8455]
MTRSVPLRRLLVALLLSCTVLVSATACGDSGDSGSATGTGVSASASAASPSASTEKQRLAKTRFVANAGLAAGATYQWIVKPYR